MSESGVIPGGHWQDEGPESPATTTGQLIRRWQEKAARLDAEATRSRTAGLNARFQIHAWETRAQALRDCASELWQLATAEDEVVDATIHAADCMNPDCAGECDGSEGQCPCGKPITHTEFCYGYGPEEVPS
jgi:hypothetical protein